jgi:hypothetical protein
MSFGYLKMSWIEVEGRKYSFKMPCFVCKRPGPWPAIHLHSFDTIHGYVVTICSEECLAMAGIITMGMTDRELTNAVIAHRNSQLEAQ